MNKYEDICTLGDGSYGVVLKCRNKETNEIVAIKKFKDRDDPENTAQHNLNLREVRMLKTCSHPFIVRLLEAFRRKQRLYLVFELCESTVLQLMEQNPSGVPMGIIKRLAFEIFRAVEYLHNNRIIHRDLKPENLLLTSENVIKVCDFGFARKVGQPEEGAPDGVLRETEGLTDYVATRWYRAPELLLNSTDYTQAVDIWAISLILAEMGTSEPLFPGDSDVDQLHLIQKALGSLTRKEMDQFLRNPKFIGLRLPDGTGDGLERRLCGKIRDEGLVDLIKSMLKMDPDERPSCKQCLASKWFDDVRQEMLNLEKKLWKDFEEPVPETAAAGRAGSQRHQPTDDENLPKIGKSSSRASSRPRGWEPDGYNQIQIKTFTEQQIAGFQITQVGHHRLPNLPRHK